ncbi:ring-opening amidohydrolase [Methylobacterium organophilum]|uniref:Cyanuric acid amidohydrolase n=1 Tax=Methylobacterium organophilum TaxID=410 RepID=A0ABQ4TCV5_METOR|nr:ring-opening amidohydrolase [Methylobacterium organophilum]UMY16140.1 ring-opening amidohydrolase [Methylobacterium organophilum]GJE28889.1 Cyanuric acid amidohydrolase [Methylobacterium organophilum]
MPECLVFRVPTRHPADTAGLLDLIRSGAVAAQEIVGIFGKTEGNGCVNDFTRPLAVMAIEAALAGCLGVTPEAVGARIALVMSGGTEGGLSPHLLVVARRDGPQAEGSALAVGTAFTPDFAPEEIGRMAQVRATAAAVAEAMAAAGITDPDDVHFVQVKCPLLTSARIHEAAGRGHTVATHDTYASMGLSRGASALGIGLALGEIPEAALDDAAIGQRRDLWSGRASASAGIELMRNEVIVLGNAPGWGGPLRIAHRVMRDGIDLPAIQGALADLGFEAAGQLSPEAGARVLALLAKAEPSHDGLIRGSRHIMNDDSDINATRHARALVGGVAAAALGRTELFVSGGAEHQGPDGGGPVAIIARVAAA